MDTYLIVVYIISFIGLFVVSFNTLNLLGQKRERIKLNEKLLPTTIIIPAYNEEDCIERTIKSALSLDYPSDKLEIIVVDDGSRDRTYEIAKGVKSINGVKLTVLTKPNGGKGSAINYGLKYATGEIILTMDADTIVNKNALREMMKYFYDRRVVAVTPAMGVYKPRTIWQRIQQIEYLVGVYLRKAFSSVNAMHVTPGAFSAYRKWFFDKHGGYDEYNITEDLEIAMRIQSHHYIIENAPRAVVYTISPPNFRELMIQRRRWYGGLIKNLKKYYFLIDPKYGILGIYMLPLALLSILTSVTIVTYTLLRNLNSLKNELLSYNAINFQFLNYIEFNKFVIERYVYSLLSRPIFLLAVLFMLIVVGFVIYARHYMRFDDSFKINLILFLAFYSMLFAFWWIVTLIFLVTHREIVWRKEKNVKV